MKKIVIVALLCALLPAALPTGVDRNSSPTDQGHVIASEVQQLLGAGPVPAPGDSVLDTEQQQLAHVTFRTTPEFPTSTPHGPNSDLPVS